MKGDHIYYVRKPQITYGIRIGILLLECYIPYIPGMIGNATTFRFPVSYKVVKGASINRLVSDHDPGLLEPFLLSAKKLIDEGVHAIAGNCGFMAQFQKQMADKLDVPVIMSSLMLVPLVSQMIGSNGKVAILTADANNLGNNMLNAIGISKDLDVHIGDLKESAHFRESILEEGGMLNADILKNDVIKIVKKMTKDDPLIKAIVLECTDIPPFAHAIQDEIGLPVFDIVSLINFMHSGLTRKPFTGLI